ncbi:DUF4286 family protein [Novosphingobium lentum]|uniref:DUF4286 family protein n=1 Tax=Novosphingobium lentum TaxID=145287 RepID=UPI00082E2E62|nr:DUF4286 family protein [Novosphingobium lentum]
MAHYRHVAFCSPLPGGEAELERWYDEQHIPDCLKLDGFVAAQRFRIEEQPAGSGVPAWNIMVIYEIESDDIAATLGQIAKVVRTPAMPMNDAIDMTTTMRLTAAAASPRFTSTS